MAFVIEIENIKSIDRIRASPEFLRWHNSERFLGKAVQG
jgi:hypothetical protein